MPRPAKKPADASARVPKVPEARRVRVRDLRANFKSLLAEGAPLLVGSHPFTKAIVLPVLAPWRYDEAEREITRHRIRALLEVALKSL